MVERLVVCCGVYISAKQWRAACNNQSETSVADAHAAVCKRPSLTLYQPVAKVISALPGLIQVDRMDVYIHTIRHTNNIVIIIIIIIIKKKKYVLWNAVSVPLPQTPQSVHKARNCGVHTLPLTMHYGREKLGENWGNELSDFDPNELDLTFGVPDYGAKFHQKFKIE